MKDAHSRGNNRSETSVDRTCFISVTGLIYWHANSNQQRIRVWFWRERRCEPSIVYIYKILRDVEGKKTADFLTSFLWIATTTHDFLCYNTMLHSLQLNVPWRATLKWQHRIYRPKISPDFLFIAIFHVFCCYFTPPKPLFYFALTPLFFLWKSPLNCKLCFILWQ